MRAATRGTEKIPGYMPATTMPLPVGDSGTTALWGTVERLFRGNDRTPKDGLGAVKTALN